MRLPCTLLSSLLTSENVTMIDLIAYLIYGVIIYFIIKAIFSSTIGHYHSHWNTLIDNFEYSSKEFYERLKTELESHGITKISIEETTYKEGGIMSHSRLYLRATWKNYQYDICGAKFGHGFFVSWWLQYKDPSGKIFISKLPFVGERLAKIFFPITYYRIDTASMFMSYAQSSVLKVIDDITNNKGVRSLTEDERKPVLSDIFAR